MMKKISKNNELEMVFTSTNTKLLQHLDRLEKIQKEGKWQPITLHLSPTDKCNLNCVFCSVKNRSGDELDFEILKNALKDFKDLGLLAVEVTGGGDPTLYPHINGVLEYIAKLNMKIGLITNGIELRRISKKNLENITWLRISLNTLDYLEDLEIPKIPENVTLGFSYVWNELSSKERLDKISQYKQKYNARYVRVVPDCLKVNSINKYRKMVPPLIKGYKDFFFQTKIYEKPKNCLIGFLKPYLASNGNIYNCTAQVLLKRDYHPDFIMGHYTNVKKIWEFIKPFKTDKCDKCFFRDHNLLLESILTEVPHRCFV